jgi:PAS domain S-box-containing protein
MDLMDIFQNPSILTSLRKPLINFLKHNDMTLKILAIDDIKDNLTVLKAVIEERFPKATVYTAINGKDGIKLASDKQPDVIILDIIMPEMDGFEVCRRLKSTPETKDIPIIFLTALKTNKESRIRALELGAEGFLGKPIDEAELMAQIQAMLKIKKGIDDKKNEKKRLEAMVAERTFKLERAQSASLDLLEDLKMEVDARKNAEFLLRESEKKFRLLFEDAPLSYQSLDNNGNYVAVNKAFLETTGFKMDEIIGHNFKEFMSPESAEKLNLVFQQFLQSGSLHNFEFEMFRKDGTTFWAEFEGRISYDEQGHQIQSHCIFTNITKRKLTEKALIESEESFRGLFDSVLEAIYLQDENGTFIEVNKGAEEMYGYSRDFFIGKTPAFISAPGKNDIPKVAALVKKAFHGEKQELEFWGKRKNGEIFPKDVRLYPGKYFGKDVVIALAKDITEQKKAEEYLKLSEERYRMISDLTSDYIFQNKINEKGENEKVWVAGSFLEITGYTFEEYKKIGGWRSVLHPDDREKDEKAFDKVKKNQKVSLEVRIRHKSGRIIWVRSLGYPIWDYKKNRLAGIMGAVKDITDEKRNQQFQEIQYNIAHSMVTSPTLHDLFLSVKNELNKIIYAKNFFIAFYNYERDTLSTQFGYDEKEFVTEYPAKKTLSGRVMKEGKPLVFRKDDIKKLADAGEIELVGKRAEVWLGAPLIIKNKTLGVIVTQSYDNPMAYDEKAIEIMGTIANQLSLYIEEKRTSEFNLKLSKATEQSPVTIMITNTEGNIEYVNPKFTEVTGYTFEEVFGKNPRILKSGEHDKAFYKGLWKTILSGKEWKGELHNKKKNGELFWENALISPIFNDMGETTHYVGVKEDITGKKKMMAELIMAKENAEESDRLKTAFLQNMSHEIRTPLNGILGFADLLTSDSVDMSEMRNYANYIKTSGNRLLALINNILDLSRIEAGSIRIHTKPFALNKLLIEAWQIFKIQADKKKIDFKYHLSLPDEQSIILSDEDKINQVVTNLLSNAFKFTSSGAVDLDYSISGKEIVFRISDTGRGIPKEHQTRIFERFYQADMSISRDFEGAGLGLPISKGLVELLGGKMWLKSEVGKGTSFYFSLPYQPAGKTSGTPSGEMMSQSKKGNPVILIVEDDETSFLYLKTVLKLAKMEWLHATNGLQAIQMCRNNPKISLVLMDLKLPGINGLEATRKIKAFRPDLPIIAQTAHAFTSDKKEASLAGCDDFITKPIPKNELMKIIMKQLG